MQIELPPMFTVRMEPSYDGPDTYLMSSALIVLEFGGHFVNSWRLEQGSDWLNRFEYGDQKVTADSLARFAAERFAELFAGGAR